MVLRGRPSTVDDISPYVTECLQQFRTGVTVAIIKNTIFKNHNKNINKETIKKCLKLLIKIGQVEVKKTTPYKDGKRNITYYGPS